LLKDTETQKFGKKDGNSLVIGSASQVGVVAELARQSKLCHYKDTAAKL